MVLGKLARRLVAAALVAPSVSCRAAAPVVPAPAHRLLVSAEPFALAEVARRVGLNRVVVDGPGEGATSAATPTQATPTVAATPTQATPTVVVSPGPGPAPWLDPTAMQAVTRRVASQLASADPTGRPAYERAASVFEAQLASLAIDYQSSLADCGRHDIVTADRAFDGLAAKYGFVDHPANEPGVAALISARWLPVVFEESGVATSAVDSLAQAAHVKVGFLSTLTLVTPAEQANGASYLSLMTDNLAALSAALACQAPT